MASAPTALVPFEFDFDYTRSWNVATGEESAGAHVRYREPGKRRWTKFLLVGNADTTLQSIDAQIEPAILAHAAGEIS